MAKITVTTDEGIIIGDIDTEGWDLSKTPARHCLFSDIEELIVAADNYTEE